MEQEGVASAHIHLNKEFVKKFAALLRIASQEIEVRIGNIVPQPIQQEMRKRIRPRLPQMKPLTCLSHLHRPLKHDALVLVRNTGRQASRWCCGRAIG